jgi:hypothetical protein
LCSDAVVERRDQVSAQVTFHFRLGAQPSGNLHRNFLQKFSGACSIMQLDFNVAIGPRPEMKAGSVDAWVKGTAALILGPDPEFRYPFGDSFPLPALWLPHGFSPVRTVVGRG